MVDRLLLDDDAPTVPPITSIVPTNTIASTIDNRNTTPIISNSPTVSTLIQYPDYEPNPTVLDFYPKVPYKEAVDIYDEFAVGLGLELLPKNRTSKVPVVSYWKRGAGRVSIPSAKSEQYKDTVSGWCLRTGEIVVLDIDNYRLELNGLEPVDVYYEIMSKCPSNFIFATPTGGIHIYYRMPSNDNSNLNGNDNNQFEPIRNTTIYDGVDVRGYGGQVVFYGSYARYDGKYAKQKGVISGHLGRYSKVLGADYSNIPYLNSELYNWIVDSNRVNYLSDGEIYAHSDEGATKVDKFELENLYNRVDIVLELCEAVLDRWSNNKTYSEWCQFWMSAYNGSSGSNTIRDFIVEHSNIYWSDGNNGKLQFISAWDNYNVKRMSYTISSLFYLARNSGWLTKTGYEITKDAKVDFIDCEYISEWFNKLDIIPNRLLLESQTGSGKTFVFSRLWRKIGKPKSVIFCPSIKLATEMANTLANEHNLPITLYKDDLTGDTIRISEMLDATILITTLQTFATKLYNRGVGMENYGLVYFEESDQLLSQFARGGGGQYSTHVTELEAQLGFKLIKDALVVDDNGDIGKIGVNSNNVKFSRYVWFVDATMTQVTYNMVNNIVGTDNFTFVKNTRVSKKSAIEFVDDKKLAYKAIIDALFTDKKVVVACDTKSEAFFIQEMLEFIKILPTIKWIVITRDTARDEKVLDFMRDVNVGASHYDLVIYNSSMGSGVSITSVVPDLIVQICTYLSSRANLQIINRYRKQAKVICYYSDYENLYGVNSKSVIKIASRRVFNELGLIDLPFMERTELAILRSEIASISIADESTQQRNAKIFYQHLLYGDGREVIDYKDKTTKINVDGIFKAVKELRDVDKEKIKSSWRTIPPIDDARPAKSNYNFMDVAYGLAHARVEKAFLGNVPDNDLVDDREIYRLANMFYTTHYILGRLLRGGGGLDYYERYLTNKDKAITAYWYDLSLMRLFSIVSNYFWVDISQHLTYKSITTNCNQFISKIREDKKIYDALFRKRQQFDSIFKSNKSMDKVALSLSKNILSLIGLKQRLKDKNNKTYYIVNYDDLVTFFRLRGIEDDLVFNSDYLRQQVEDRRDSRKLYDVLADDIKNDVLDMLSTEQGMSFKAAISIATSEGELS